MAEQALEIKQLELEIKQFALESKQLELVQADRELQKSKCELQEITSDLEITTHEKVMVERELDRATEKALDDAEQKGGIVGKLYSTVDEKVHQHRVWSSTHGFLVLRINPHAPEHTPCYYAIRNEHNTISRTIKS